MDEVRSSVRETGAVRADGRTWASVVGSGCWGLLADPEFLVFAVVFIPAMICQFCAVSL